MSTFLAAVLPGLIGAALGILLRRGMNGRRQARASAALAGGEDVRVPVSLRVVASDGGGRWQTGSIRAASGRTAWRRSLGRKSAPVDFANARETGSRQVHGAEFWLVNRHCVVIQLQLLDGRYELAVLPGDLAAARTVLRL